MEGRDHTPGGIWVNSFKFYIDNAPKFIVIFPLLFIPVYVDTLLSVLIKQQREEGGISMFQGLFITLAEFPKVFYVKLRFYLLGGLWSIIPIYGWYKSYRYRICWAMSSNVVIHESLRGENAVRRCRELTEQCPPSIAFRTLVTFPSIIEAVLTVGILAGTTLTDDPTIFGLCMFGILWTWFPWSAAVNTNFYFAQINDAV